MAKAKGFLVSKGLYTQSSYRDYYIYRLFNEPPKGELFEPGSSVVVPHQSLTINQIIERHKAGLDVPGNSMSSVDTLSNFDTPDLEKIRTLDLVERIELYQFYADQTKKINDVLESRQKKIDELESRKKQKFQEDLEAFTKWNELRGKSEERDPGEKVNE